MMMGMKMEKFVTGILLLAFCAGSQLNAERDGESFEETKAKAEKGDATAQIKLGWMY